MPVNKEKILIIVGPTASGKSGLAVRIAKKYGGEVVSADSRQVYKGLDAGSGKISKREMCGIPHHLLDVADPKKQFSVAQYRKLAEKAIEDILSRGRLPVVVGGTGFYIDALTGAASLPDVPPNKKLRKELGSKTAEVLFSLLRKKDPARAKTIDMHNRVRLIRALEIAHALGKVPRPEATKPRYDFVWIGLKPEKEDLEEKILKRLGARIPDMIREAKRLHSHGLSYKRMEELGLEYRYLARLLEKRITRKEFVDQLYREIKRYSKRQHTWFKRNKDITWYPDAQSAYADIQARLG